MWLLDRFHTLSLSLYDYINVTYQGCMTIWWTTSLHFLINPDQPSNFESSNINALLHLLTSKFFIPVEFQLNYKKYKPVSFSSFFFIHWSVISLNTVKPLADEMNIIPVEAVWSSGKCSAGKSHLPHSCGCYFVTPSIYLNIDADQTHSFMAMVFPKDSVLFNRIMLTALMIRGTW